MRRVTWLVVGILGMGTGAHASDARFVEAEYVGGYSRAVADYNGDGRLDVAYVVAAGNTTVTVLYGNGTGGFRAGTTFSSPGNPVEIQAVDVNHDGWPDLAIRSSGTRRSDIYLNQLNGTFGAGIRTPESSPGSAPMLFGDINNDGLIDLIHRSSGTATYYYLGTGKGTFGAQTSYLTNETPVLCELNGDGAVDLVTYHNTNWRVYHNDAIAGTVSYTLRQDFTIPAGFVYDLYADNLDGVSGAEILLRNYISNGGTNDEFNSLLFVNDGSGMFGSSTTLDPGGPFLGTGYAIPSFADLDGDGLREILDERGILHATAPGVYGRRTGLASSPFNDTVGCDLNSDGFVDLVSSSIHFGVAPGGSIASTRTFPVGSLPNVALLGDFDGDGKNDILTGEDHLSDGGYTLLKGTGAGNFETSSTGSLTSFRVEHGASGDFDGDGRADAALGRRSGSGVILKGQSNGTLSSAVSFSGGNYVIAGDLTGDNRPELIAGVSFDSPAFYLNINDGSGNFTGDLIIGPAIGPQHFVLAEATGDTHKDLLFTASFNGNVFVLPGDGTGGLGSPVTVATGYSDGLAGVAVHDFNADTLPDLVIAQRSFSQLLIHLGTGAGTWQNVATRTSMNGNGLSEPTYIEVVDLTGDGVKDLLVTLVNSSQFLLYESNNDGTFDVPVPINSLSNTYTVAVGDVLGDGSVGFVSSSSTLESAVVHFMRPLRSPSASIVDGRTVDVSIAGYTSADMLNPIYYGVGGEGIGSLAVHPSAVAESSPGNYRLTWGSGEMKSGGTIEVGLSPAMAGPGSMPAFHSERATATGVGIGGALPTSQITAVDNVWFVSDPVTGSVTSSDDDQVGRIDIYARHEDGGSWALVGRRTASLDGFSAVPGNLPGTYYLQSVAYDKAGHEEAGGVPSGTSGIGDISVVYVPLINGPLTLDVPTGPSVELLFPLTNDLSVTIILPNVTVGGTITVERQQDRTNTAGIPENTLIPQKWIITSSIGLTWDTATGATIIFEYDDSSTGLGLLSELDDLNIVYAVESTPEPPREYEGSQIAFDYTNNRLTVTGVTGFSTWYVGTSGEVTASAEYWMFW